MLFLLCVVVVRPPLLSSSLNKEGILKRVAVGYGLPLIIAAFIFVREEKNIMRNHSSERQFCLVDVRSSLGAVLFIPMGIAVLATLLLLIQVWTNTGRAQFRVKSIVASTQGLGATVVLASISWFVGVFFLSSKATHDSPTTSAREYITMLAILSEALVLFFYEYYKRVHSPTTAMKSGVDILSDDILPVRYQETGFLGHVKQGESNTDLSYIVDDREKLPRQLSLTRVAYGEPPSTPGTKSVSPKPTDTNYDMASPVETGVLAVTQHVFVTTI